MHWCVRWLHLINGFPTTEIRYGTPSLLFQIMHSSSDQAGGDETSGGGAYIAGPGRVYEDPAQIPAVQ